MPSRPATKKKPAARRATRTRAETEQEFQTLADQVHSAEPSDRVSRDVAKTERDRVRSASVGLTVEAVANSTTALSLQLSQALSDVQQQLVAKVQELEDTRAAVAVEKEELERLYNIDVAAASIENLVEEHAKKTQDNEAAISAQRTKQNEEAQAFDKKEKERQASIIQTRTREEVDYTYVREQTRKREDDVWEQVKLTRTREFNQQEAERTASLDARMKAIEAQEKEIADLRTKAAGYDAHLAKEVAKAEAIARNTVTKDLTHVHELAKKDLETQLQIANARVTQADQDKAILAQQISNLSSKLEQAQEKIVEIANKSVEGASGHMAMQKMQETIATTQNNGNRGGKA